MLAVSHSSKLNEKGAWGEVNLWKKKKGKVFDTLSIWWSLSDRLLDAKQLGQTYTLFLFSCKIEPYRAHCTHPWLFEGSFSSPQFTACLLAKMWATHWTVSNWVHSLKLNQMLTSRGTTANVCNDNVFLCIISSNLVLFFLSFIVVFNLANVYFRAVLTGIHNLLTQAAFLQI